MTKSSLIVLIIIVILVVLGFGLYLTKGDKVPITDEEPEKILEEEMEEEASEEENVGEKLANFEDVSITYSSTGFSPKAVEVFLGQLVRFENQSGSGMWVASGPHPTHTNYPEFDQRSSVETGGAYEFTFDKIGNWPFHNHLNPSHTGIVIVI